MSRFAIMSMVALGMPPSLVPLPDEDLATFERQFERPSTDVLPASHQPRRQTGPPLMRSVPRGFPRRSFGMVRS